MKLNEMGYVKADGARVMPYKNLISNRGYSEKMFYFPDGLPGFEESKEFAFVFNEKTNPYILMNFCGDSKLSFMCLDPRMIISDYEVKLDDDTKMSLNINDPSDIVVLCIVKIDKENMASGKLSCGTLLKKSPLIVNVKNCWAKQIAVNFFTDNPRFEEIKKLELSV